MTATRARGARPLAAAAILSLLIIVVVPLAFVVLQAIFPSIGSGSLKAPFSHFADVIGDPLLWRLARNTVSLGLCVVILAALIGAPLGYLRAVYQLPGGAVWDLIFLIPFMMRLTSRRWAGSWRCSRMAFWRRRQAWTRVALFFRLQASSA